MTTLTDIQKKTLQKHLRRAFDTPTTTRTECVEILDLAIDLDLNEDFRTELAVDIEYTF